MYKKGRIPKTIHASKYIDVWGTIDKLRKELQRYKSLCMHDYLTGVFNRRKLEHDIERYLDLHKRYKINFLVVMIDLNNFKELNDTKGHKAGDRLLKKVGKILHTSIRKYEKIYRLGGDEFIIIFSHCNSRNKLDKRIKEILAKNNISASVGKSKLRKDILEVIDKRMYEDKRRKK